MMLPSAETIDDQKRPISGLFGIGAPSWAEAIVAWLSSDVTAVTALEILRKTFALQLPNADQIAEVALRSSIGTFKARGTVPAMQAVADSMTENKLLPGKVDLAPVVLP